MNALTGGILFFLGASLLLYVLFAGADFGAGILELALGKKRRKEQRELISHAMAPVWEANHVWLILAVVILFMGFPRIYTVVSTALHLPVLAVLMGIVARGCAFTFRHYDALGQNYYEAYSSVFSWSSLWTSFFLGVIAGAMMLGRIDPPARDFIALYVHPWWNGFSAAMGIFTSALFAFLASVYLIGEARDEEMRSIFRRKAAVTAGGTVLAGAAVFAFSEAEGLGLIRGFLSRPLCLAALILATLLWFPFWRLLMKGKAVTWLRLLGAGIVALVLLGWFAVQYPVAVRMAGESITFEESAAPEATQRVLLGALLIGSCLIFPALAYLLTVFKRQTFERERKSLR